MASKKKKYPNPKGVGRGTLYANFVSDLLSGVVKADKLEEKDNGNGKFDFDYYDPTEVE